jgi:hypothetical protein
MTEKMPAKQIVSCGDVSCELLVDPIPRPRPEPIIVQLKPKKRRVVLVDNRKPNSMAILTRAQRIFRERGIEVGDEIFIKPSAAHPMADDMLDQLAQDPGLILCGVSD